MSEEAQEVDMSKPHSKKRRKKEIVSNKWTQSMTFVKDLYKCNILGCTATPKGPKVKTPITTVFGTPSSTVPIQSGVEAGIIHDPASIKISHFSPRSENNNDAGWDEIEVLDSSEACQTKKEE